MNHILHSRTRFVIAILFTVSLTTIIISCAATKQAKNVETHGFLKDYSQLKPGGKDHALLRYVDENADWARYKKMIIYPVTIWRGRWSDINDIPREDLQSLADYLNAALVSRLSENYLIVDRPGPDVMILRAAITETKGSVRSLNIVSMVPPILIMDQIQKSLVTGTYTFVGEASVEAEILDSLSHERLAAFVDRRAGGKAPDGKTDTWGDVRNAFDFWVDRLSSRLAEGQ